MAARRIPRGFVNTNAGRLAAGSLAMSKTIPFMFVLIAALATPAGAAEIDWTKLDQAFGKPAAVLPGGVH